MYKLNNELDTNLDTDLDYDLDNSLDDDDLDDNLDQTNDTNNGLNYVPKDLMNLVNELGYKKNEFYVNAFGKQNELKSSLTIKEHYLN